MNLHSKKFKADFPLNGPEYVSLGYAIKKTLNCIEKGEFNPPCHEITETLMVLQYRINNLGKEGGDEKDSSLSD